MMLCTAVCPVFCGAQQLQVPASAVAGQDLNLTTAGSGRGSFYLLGPGISRKTEVDLGEPIDLAGQDLRNAGEYTAVLCAGSCQSARFFVIAAKPSSLTFLVHPSRVPVAQGDAISGVAFSFDPYHNLTRSPLNIRFQLGFKGTALWARTVRTQNGVAWFRANSWKSAGPVQVAASSDQFSTTRVVQQVASDPCNLRITGQHTRTGILVQTEPVHDCAGNVVSDGTVITFTATGADGKATVDAPIKQGVASAQMKSAGPTVISVASGVVMGNEIHLGAQP